jgi:hypothetical protein
VLDDEQVSQSQLPPVVVVDHHAALGAAVDWRLAVVLPRAAVAPVDEEVLPPADLLRPLRVEVEGARPLRCLVHHVLAVAEFVGGGRQRADVSRRALFLRIQISLVLTRVSVGIDEVVARAANKPAGVLVEGVGHWRTVGQSTAAVELAVGLAVGHTAQQNACN